VFLGKLDAKLFFIIFIAIIAYMTRGGKAFLVLIFTL